MEIANRYARLYGVRDYQPLSGIPELPAAETNLDLLHSALEAWGFTVNAVLNPVREQITVDLSVSARRVGADDLFLLYLTGHSFPGEGSRDIYFATGNTHDPGDISEHGLALDRIIDRLGRVRARAKVLILDSCYSGAVAHLPRTLDISPAGTSLAVMASSRLGRKSFVVATGPEEDPLSVYTRALLAAIAGFEDAGAETVSLAEFTDSVHHAMASGSAGQEPRHLVHGLGGVPLLKRRPPARPFGHLQNGFGATVETGPDFADLGGLASAVGGDPDRGYRARAGRLRRVTNERTVIRTVNAEGQTTMIKTVTRQTIEEWDHAPPAAIRSSNEARYRLSLPDQPTEPEEEARGT
ncbi:caspase family protein [Phytomonospora sp. NPDC050363]|uniref:caspase family protein n=1 Tax=Phytomonospora sp. NPDC050363 TaxID=3155642 RepID=UPI0033DFA376